MTRKTLNIAIAAALFGSLALVGCKKQQDETAAAPPPAADEPATAPMEPAPMPAAATTVQSVDLGSAIGADNRIDSPTATFAPTDTIHASVTTDGGAPGKLGAKWTFEDGQVVNTEEQDVTAGPQVTEFHISKPDGFPAGKYKLEVSLDGQVVQTRDFEVR